MDSISTTGLVVFDDHADVVVPTASLQSFGVDEVKAAIGNIRPGGSTDLSAGYLLGLSEAGRAMSDGGASVLLISDGHANSGETSPEVIGNLAEGWAARGRITTTTIGYGLGYDEELLVALARGGNGDHVLAEDVDQLHPAIAEQVSGLLAKAVTATSVTIRPLGEGLAGIRVLHDVPAAHIGDKVIAEFGDLYQGESRRLLIQLDIPAMAALGLATVAERYTELPDLVEHVITLPVTVNVVPDPVAAGRVPDPVVTVERLLQQAQQSKRTPSPPCVRVRPMQPRTCSLARCTCCPPPAARWTLTVRQLLTKRQRPIACPSRDPRLSSVTVMAQIENVCPLGPGSEYGALGADTLRKDVVGPCSLFIGLPAVSCWHEAWPTS